jgi:hypothetical protein
LYAVPASRSPKIRLWPGAPCSSGTACPGGCLSDVREGCARRGQCIQLPQGTQGMVLTVRPSVWLQLRTWVAAEEAVSWQCTDPGLRQSPHYFYNTRLRHSGPPVNSIYATLTSVATASYRSCGATAIYCLCPRIDCNGGLKKMSQRH